MKVLAIVVTYNGEKWVDSCLSSLVATPQISEILVIDNNSSDRTLKVVAEKFPRARIVQSEENLGFGGGNNVGIKIAIERGADYLFLLNQDAWVETTTVGTLVSIAEANPEFGILSPIHLNGDGDLLDRRFLDHLCQSERKLFTDCFMARTEKVYEVKFINAAAWLIRMDCIKTVGLFDPIFFHYGEDCNYIDRCRYFGYKTGLCLDTMIWHDREERVGGQKVDRAYKFEPMRTGWAVIQTDPGDDEWDVKHSLRLIHFVARKSIRSFTHLVLAPITYIRLWFYRGTIAKARARMKKGYSDYVAEDQ